MPLRISSDIGGTFTDMIIADDAGKIFQIAKVLTTADQPDDAVMAGIDQLLEATSCAPGEVAQVLHATTLFTNALIERKGARTALVTTKGFRDAVEIGREHRYDMYDLFIKRSLPLAPRPLRFELDERILADGSVLKTIEESEAVTVAHELRRRDVEAVAICLINSYINATHERKLAEIIRRELPDIALTVSSDLVPEIGELDRSSTALANVYVQRIAEQYLARLQKRLGERGIDGRLLVMQSNGGLCDANIASRYPIRVVESGPAAGAIAAAHLIHMLGHDRVLSFDMGGTTAKACIIMNGEPLIAPDFEVDRQYQFKKGSGLPVKVPVVELIEIGTGGGSIAHVDALGRLCIGPRSAGSRPGPACYGLGGVKPTVTDADLVLGYLDEASFLGGSMRLDRRAAERAIDAEIGTALSSHTVQAAWAMHQMANESMASAARIHAIERGCDLEKFPLLAFGGAGPVHAYGIARILRNPFIIYPPAAGVMSAAGLLVAPVTFDVVRTLASGLDKLDWTFVQIMIAEMRAEAAMLIEGAAPVDMIRYRCFVDMRYRKQGATIRVEMPGGDVGPDAAAALSANFEDTYRRIYGHLVPDAAIETVSWRVIALGPAPHIHLPHATEGDDPGRGLRGRRPVYLPDGQGFAEVPVYDRRKLPVGSRFEGPAIVEERESTAAILGRAELSIDVFGNLIAMLG